jgi:hypothetical protein
MTQTLLLVAAGIVLVLILLFWVLRAGGMPLNGLTARHIELVRRRMKDPVSATLQVTGISEPSFGAAFCTGQITGLVSGNGIEPQAVQRTGMIDTARWPKVGQRLPILIDRARPGLFVVDATNQKSDGDAALDEAERLAAETKAGTD